MIHPLPHAHAHCAAPCTGKTLQWCRAAYGLTQRELAHYVGVTERTIARLETLPELNTHWTNHFTILFAWLAGKQ